MKKNRLLVLSGILILCLAGWLGLRHYNASQEEEAEVEEAGDTLFTVSVEDISDFSFVRNGVSYEFRRSDDGWYYTGDTDFPTDSDAVDDLLSPLENLQAIRTLTGVDDLTQYGLENPNLILTVANLEGVEYSLKIGSLNSSTGDYYVRMQDDDTVYTIESTLPMNFQISLYDLAVTESFPSIDSSEVTGLEVETKDHLFTAVLDKSSTTAWTVSDGNFSWDGDEEQIISLADGLGSFYYISCLEYECQNPEAYGLEDPYAYLTVDYTEISASGSTSEEDTGEDDDMEETNAGNRVTFAIGDTDEQGNYYVQRKGSNEVHTISSSYLSPFLEADAVGYRSLLLSNMTMDETAKVNLEYNGTTYSYVQIQQQEENEDGETVINYYCTRNGQEFDVDTYQSFFKIARGMTAQSYLTDAQKNEQQEQITGRLLEGAQFQLIFEETDGRIRKVAYYPYNDNFYLGIVDDTEYALVNKMDAVTLLEYIETVTK